jgi:FkbM family methyltransferase
MALAALGRGKSFSLSLGEARINIQSVSDLGTLQSCIIDINEELMMPPLLGHTPFLVDVGANIGQWTASVKLFLPDAQILAVEPDPQSFDQLKSNVSNLSGVECINCAAGSEPGYAPLYRQPLSTMSTLQPSSGDTLDDVLEVLIQPLDDLLQDHDNIDLLKIDVEGSELDVLRGCKRSLENSALLLVEISLARGSTNGINFLAELKQLRPKARIIKFGRPLGHRSQPLCQDVLLALN